MQTLPQHFNNSYIYVRILSKSDLNYRKMNQMSPSVGYVKYWKDRKSIKNAIEVIIIIHHSAATLEHYNVHYYMAPVECVNL